MGKTISGKISYLCQHAHSGKEMGFTGLRLGKISGEGKEKHYHVDIARPVTMGTNIKWTVEQYKITAKSYKSAMAAMAALAEGLAETDKETLEGKITINLKNNDDGSCLATLNWGSPQVATDPIPSTEITLSTTQMQDIWRYRKVTQWENKSTYDRWNSELSASTKVRVELDSQYKKIKKQHGLERRNRKWYQFGPMWFRKLRNAQKRAYYLQSKALKNLKKYENGLDAPENRENLSKIVHKIKKLQDTIESYRKLISQAEKASQSTNNQ